jgi:hypothetical protein
MISSVIGQIIGVNEQYFRLVGHRPDPDLHLGAVAGCWMTFKGFRRDSPLMVEAAEAASRRASSPPHLTDSPIPKAGVA